VLSFGGFRRRGKLSLAFPRMIMSRIQENRSA
jgi:hypothetical protein